MNLEYYSRRGKEAKNGCRMRTERKAIEPFGCASACPPARLPACPPARPNGAVYHLQVGISSIFEFELTGQLREGCQPACVLGDVAIDEGVAWTRGSEDAFGDTGVEASEPEDLRSVREIDVATASKSVAVAPTRASIFPANKVGSICLREKK